jgi:hypothetical protein
MGAGGATCADVTGARERPERRVRETREKTSSVVGSTPPPTWMHPDVDLTRKSRKRRSGVRAVYASGAQIS